MKRTCIAQEQYSGKAVDALLSYIADTTHSSKEGSDVTK
jgi:hypothetical protein